MLDLRRMERIRLFARPRTQELVAQAFLRPFYDLGDRVHIEVEGADRLPPHPVVIAMNHTDRYNYWPFQYWLYRNVRRYTATWVKAKYFEGAAVGAFMEHTNNIPAVSRGYLITKDFIRTTRRRPSEREYDALRALVDGREEGIEARRLAPRDLFEQPRDMLGRYFAPDRESYEEAMRKLFGRMMKRFVELHVEAFEKNLDLLVFPQGTRSIRLSAGHGGISQIALRFQKTIVPVGCNGSDLVYPGGSPIPKRGAIVYRVGEPISYDEMAPFHVKESFEPFSIDAETKHHAKFAGLAKLVMDRIEPLLDERYRYGDGKSDGVSGSKRFV